MKHLETLNTEQKKAVTKTDGPLLVIAGAGSGKTRVITYRILHLIATGKALPEEILAITFTNKAAREMKDRTLELLKGEGYGLETDEFGENENAPTIKTFHSLGVSILKEFGEKVGLSGRFTIYDRGDSLKIVKDVMKKMGLDPQDKENPAEKFLSIISKRKGDGLSFSDTSEGQSPFGKVLVQVWEGYEKGLREDKACDFDDLLLLPYKIIKENPEIKEKLSRRFQYLHVDEYQDTNKVQYYITNLLSEKHKNICVVGDADQNIYSWRGAKIGNILNFEKDYPEAEVVELGQNYRSSQRIIELAEEVIKKNSMRIPKSVFTENEEGEKPKLISAGDERREAKALSGEIESLISSGIKPSEIAVLYRTNFQSRALEEVFLSRAIPYQILGTKFFDRKEIKDILFYVEASINRKSSAALSRIISTPPRGIGKVTLLKIIEGKENELSSSMKSKVQNFFLFLDKIESMTKTSPPSEVLEFVFEKSGLKEHLEGDAERALNIADLIYLAGKYDKLPPREGMEKLLEEAYLSSDEKEVDDEEEGSVKLLTAHSSKGLEFDVVFIAGLEEGLFPITRDNKEEEEEERRLFYVASTRAKKLLYLSWAETRRIYGKQEINIPSRFIEDVEEHLEIIDRQNEYLDIDTVQID